MFGFSRILGSIILSLLSSLMLFLQRVEAQEIIPAGHDALKGFFIDGLLFSALFIVTAVFAGMVLVYCMFGRRWNRRLILHDYSDKPKDEIIYYQMLSDIVAQMRLRIGDDAFKIAQNIPDLEIDTKTGRIVRIKKDPAKIIALLISRYEKLSGNRISFGLRNP